MSHIPRDFIEQLITRSDLIEIIQERVSLKKAGKNFVACCPFHQEKTPSFNVNPIKQFYHCFGCGVSGNVISFLMDFDRLGFLDTIEFLARRAGLEIPREANADHQKQKTKLDDVALLEKVSLFYQQQLKQTEPAIQYLKSRGITGNTAKHFGIGFSPNRWDAVLKEFKEGEKLLEVGLVIAKENEKGFYDRFRNRVMFPIRNARGQVIGFGGRVLDDSLPKYLNSPETLLFQKNQELYGWHEALQSTRKLQQVFVVEGYLDVVSLHQAGITEAVATLGTATSSEHIQKISRQCQHIIFCFDGDRAGRDAAWRALNSALSVLQDGLQIQFLFLPDGEDPDSFVQKNGADAFREFSKSALPLSEYLLNHLSEGINLQQAEGRGKLVKDAIALLNKIPEGALLQMLCEALAQKTKFDLPTLTKLLQESKKPGAQSETFPEDSTQRYRLQLTPMRLAIALLLHHPACAKKEDAEKIHRLVGKISGADLLEKLLSSYLDNPKLSTAALLENWRETKEFPYLLKLATLELDFPDEATLQNSWQDSLKRLAEQENQLSIEALMSKMKTSGLSEEENAQLLGLIRNT